MLKLVSILLALATAAGVEAALPRTDGDDWTARLPPRQNVAGLSGFESVSVLHYAADPDEKHELTCLYVFPARARWQITVRGKPELGRHVEYRCGDAYFELAQSSDRSAEVGATAAQPNQRESKCELFELRRAAFLWPDGFDWTGEGSSRSALTECGRKLTANLDPDGRPSSLSFEPQPLRGDESLHIRSWRNRHERWWPDVLEFRQGSNLVWSEHVESLTTRLALLDSYFVPPDRRALAGALREAHVLHFDAPPQHEIRLGLEQTLDWADAARIWAEFQQRVAAELPSEWRCLPAVAFELNDQGLPTAAIVRLRGSGAPPKGVVATAAEQALTTSEPWPIADLKGARDRLRRSIPGEASLGRVLLLFSGPPASAASVQVVATLRAKH